MTRYETLTLLIYASRVAQGGPLAVLVENLVDDARLPVDQADEFRRDLGQGRSPLQSRPVAQHAAARALEPPTRGLQDILHGFFATPAAPETRWSDFEHLGEARDFIARLLKGALTRRAEGVNILLYGPPDTDKTEFCKQLATHLGAQLFAVDETDDDGDEPLRSER